MTKTLFDLFDIAVKKWDSQPNATLSELTAFFRVFRAFRGYPLRPQTAPIRLHSRNSMTKTSSQGEVRKRRAHIRLLDTIRRMKNTVR
jgi:hypothetical protein